MRRTIAVLLASGLVAGTAFAQAVPNPTQQSIDPARGSTPLFRVTVIGRTTAAINYRPRRGDTKIDMAGTALLPLARGSAKVAGEQGYMKIEARFEKLEPASRFGREYLTYVLWAITPEGRATNLGEIQVDDANAKVEVTTELQAFGLIVTAEPYFAVTQPSDVVVVENVIRSDTKGSFEVVEAKHELLTRGAYLMNQDAARLTVKPLEPGSPLDLAQARNAVELARLAGADRFATETFNKAAGLLATAEEARVARRGGNAIMMAARQAAQTAEDARLVGLTRQEEAYQADQRAAALAREQNALTRAEDEIARRRSAEAATQAATAGRLAAERDASVAADARLAAERETTVAADARLAAERDARTAGEARVTAERDARIAADSQLAAERARATDADAARIAAETARVAAETARAQADAARVAAAAQAQSDATSAAAKAESDKAVLREQLRGQLNVILDTRATARGLIVNLSDVLFDTGRADLKPGAREKLARISGILALHQGLRLEVEGHTDSVGTDAANQRLSERRGESVRAYLVQQGIASSTVGTIGLGEAKPVATNDTAVGRQQNRRVELVVSGQSIGTF
jgi:outer membrane protein OmpA-like peptidoglycan-associated protein